MVFVQRVAGNWWFRVAAVVLVAGAIIVPSIGTASARPDGSRTAIVGDATVFNFLPGMARYDRAEALAAARANDLIVAHGPTFTDHVDAMREANPDLQILVYRKSVTAWSDEGDAFPDDWYLRDASGDKVTSDPWGSFLMDPRSPGWRQHTVDDCLAYVQQYDYDGCYLDVLGTGALHLMRTTPVTHAGGPAFDDATFYATLLDYARHVRAGVPAEIPLLSNSLGAGGRYFHDTWPSAELGSIIGAAHSEIWLRGGRDHATDFKDAKWWQRDLEMLVDAGQRGIPLLVTTKLWTDATDEQVEQWREYSYGTFLLGTDGTHSWGFTADKGTVDDRNHPLYQLDLGDPIGSYGNVGELFVRTFERGIVVVNPGTSSQAMDLGGVFGDHSGRLYGSIGLAPNTGRVLVAATVTGADAVETVDPIVEEPAPEPRRGDDTGASGSICEGHAATIVGTDGPDVLIGTRDDDVIVGLGGDDRIEGLAGDDIICAGDGNDIVFAGGGDDVVRAGDGDDLVRGHGGTDDLDGEAGQDVVAGNRGYDFLSGGPGDDRLVGGSGVDRCKGGGGVDLARTCEHAAGTERS